MSRTIDAVADSNYHDDMPSSPTMRAAREWVTGRRARREITPATAAGHLSILAAFADTVGAKPVNQLGRHDVQRWLEHIGPLAPNTRRHQFGVVRAFGRWLVAEDRVRRDPTGGVQRPKVPRSVPRAIPDDDCTRILDAIATPRERAIVVLMLGMGLRRAEVAGLERSDYDEAGGLLTIRGKGGHVRILPVPDVVRAAILGYVTTTAGPLIRSEVHPWLGIGPRQVGFVVRDVMERAGVKARPGDGRACHSLRHTLASRIVDVEPDLRVVQAVLGHVSLQSTQVYLRRAEMGRVRSVLELVDSAAMN